MRLDHRSKVDELAVHTTIRVKLAQLAFYEEVWVLFTPKVIPIWWLCALQIGGDTHKGKLVLLGNTFQCSIPSQERRKMIEGKIEDSLGIFKSVKQTINVAM